MNLAEGVLVQDKGKPGLPVYAEPPNVQAITYILDQAFGKAKQSIEHSGEMNGIYERLLLGLGKAAAAKGRDGGDPEAES